MLNDAQYDLVRGALLALLGQASAIKAAHSNGDDPEAMLQAVRETGQAMHAQILETLGTMRKRKTPSPASQIEILDEIWEGDPVVLGAISELVAQGVAHQQT